MEARPESAQGFLLRASTWQSIRLQSALLLVSMMTLAVMLLASQRQSLDFALGHQERVKVKILPSLVILDKLQILLANYPEIVRQSAGNEFAGDDLKALDTRVDQLFTELKKLQIDRREDTLALDQSLRNFQALTKVVTLKSLRREILLPNDSPELRQLFTQHAENLQRFDEFRNQIYLAYQEEIEKSQDLANQSYRRGAYQLGGILFLGLLCLAVIERKLIRPIIRLTNASRALIQGRSQQIIPPRFSSEIASLTQNFNEMIKTIRDQTLKLSRLVDQLATKDKTRTSFFHNTSHELRTPLNGIIGYLELTQQGQFGGIDPKVRLQLEKALRLAYGLRTLVNTILDLAKSRSGQMKIHTSALSLEELKEDIDVLAEGLLLQYSNTVYSSDLVIEDGQTVFITDSQRLKTALHNLVGNAFKFRDPSRPNHVSVTFFASKGLLEVEISDLGIGIPPAWHSKIFDEFVQVHSDARRAYEGSGLGLTMVRELLKVLGGSIKLGSQEGEGSTFRIKIPEQRSIDSTGSTADSNDLEVLLARAGGSDISLDKFTLREQKSDRGRGFKILVIDDNPTNCEVIAEILKMEGYTVGTAEGGRLGLAALEKQKPDLILLDLMMPELSGEDVLKSLRSHEETASIPIILITARASEEDRVLGLRLGADDYLAKPILADELRFRVSNLLQHRQRALQLQGAETNDKLAQLGEICHDLSQELQDILSATASRIKLEDIAASLSTTVYPPGLIQETARAWLSHNSRIALDTLTDSRALPLTDPVQPELAELRRLLIETPLSQAHIEELWQALRSRSPLELATLNTQLKILSSLRQSLDLDQRLRQLTHAVLHYTRVGDPSCDIAAGLEQLKTLLQFRVRRTGADLRTDAPRGIVGHLPQGVLQQALISLCLYALKAVSQLAPEQRWIHISLAEATDCIHLAFSYGGPALPQNFAERMFHLAPSAGQPQDYGLSFFIARRLLLKEGGELSIDTKAPHPLFILRLPREAQTPPLSTLIQSA